MKCGEEKLFTPIKIGSVEIKNRINQPSMCMAYNAPDGHMNDRYRAYLRQRAVGGIGLLTVPGSPHGKVSSARLAASDDIYIEDWREAADIVHEYGTKLFCQIHPAKFQAGKGHNVEMPKDYQQEDIERLINSYAEAARRMKAAGVDGVEIHGAHAHEVAQFMSPYYNHRTDDYGGDIQGFAKFPSEIIKGIKALCGKDFPVVMRISGNEHAEGGRTIEDSAKICQILEAAGVDAISVSTGIPVSDRYISAPMDMEDCFNVEDAYYIKQRVHVPIIAVDRIVDVEQAVEVIESGKADMVAMARAFLADSEILNKYLGINPEPVRRCVGCNQGCRDNNSTFNKSYFGQVICMQNPYLSFTEERILKPAAAEEKDKKIVIAGAGPAGLEVACGLAARGFSPVIYEKRDSLGGLVTLASKAPGKKNMDSIREYRENYLKQKGVEIHCGVELTSEMVQEMKPDVLVVATGSRPVVPSIPGIDGDKVFICDEVLEGKIPEGKRIAVLGGGLIGCEIAELLAEAGKEVVVVDVISEIAKNLNSSRKDFMIERISRAPISFYLEKKVTAINFPEIAISGEHGEEILHNIDALVVAAGRKPVNELAEVEGVKVVTIGDAKQVGLALDAIHEAAEVACAL